MKKIFITIGCMATLACSGSNETPETEMNGQPKRIQLTTRASDAQVSEVGIYMTYGSMQASDNYLDNMLLSNNGAGSWTPAQQLYWRNNTEAATLTGYAPYQAFVADATALPFQTQQDQSFYEAQQASDFLYGRLDNQAPTDQVLNLTLGHLFSRVLVKVAPGEGFTTEELTNGTLGVRLNGLCTQATINLAGGSVTPQGTAVSVVPLEEQPLQYSAIVVPQQVAETGLVTVSWSGADYTLRRAMNFEAGRQYTMTVTLKKTSGGINIGIDGWTDTGEDFGGTVN